MKKIFRRTFGKLRAKILLATILVFIAFFVVIRSISYPLLFRSLSRRTYTELCEIAYDVDELVPESGNYYTDLYNIAMNHNADFEIVSSDGYLVYTSRGTGAATSTSHFASASNTLPEYSEMAFTSEYDEYNLDFENFDVRKKAESGSAYFVYSYDLYTGDRIYVYSAVADVENVVTVADNVYLTISIVTITLLCTIFIILVTRLSKPVEEMNEVTRDMAALNFDRKCNDYGGDEVGELGRSINTLSDRLDETLADLKEKNLRLEKDIEMRLALDNARKDFISNVSHELKTPIAIISGYAEGVCEGISDDPEVMKEYCKVIMDESGKMNDLVLKLLELSKLESDVVGFEPDYFDIGEKIKTIISHLSLKTEEKGITIINNVPSGTMCYAQSDKIETVLGNYITNAISHVSGEKKIIIDCTQKEKTIEISIFNTGSHIADEDMSSIWDSFYRADKSHDRSEKRFGLGLSIVKTIMERHGCSYGAENTEDGVIFRFEVAGDSEFYE